MYYFVYHIDTIALYWEEKPTSLMNENKIKIKIFYVKQEVETLGKNSGVSSHTWQLQEKI